MWRARTHGLSSKLSGFFIFQHPKKFNKNQKQSLSSSEIISLSGQTVEVWEVISPLRTYPFAKFVRTSKLKREWKRFGTVSAQNLSHLKYLFALVIAVTPSRTSGVIQLFFFVFCFLFLFVFFFNIAIF